MFSKKELADDIITENMASSVNSTNDTNTFLESLKNTENEETLLLKLQKQYSTGEVKAEDLTYEQLDALCKLYEKQNEELKKSIQTKKQKLLEYKKMQS